MPPPVAGSPQQMRFYKRVTEALAQNLRRIRAKGGWSQEEAAHRADLSLNAYHRIEAAHVNVTMATLARLALGFGVEVSELLKLPRRMRKTAEPTSKSERKA